MNQHSPILVRVGDVLQREPWLTATEVAHRLGEKPSTVSSVMYRATLVELLVRRASTTVHRGWEYDLPSDMRDVE